MQKRFLLGIRKFDPYYGICPIKDTLLDVKGIWYITMKNRIVPSCLTGIFFKLIPLQLNFISETSSIYTT